MPTTHTELVRRLEGQIETLRLEMLKLEHEALPEGVDPDHLPGARNLLHYVALRRHDIRDLQQDLAALGLSSLGRTESHVLATIHAVRNSLSRLNAGDQSQKEIAPAGGKSLLEQNTEALLGPVPERRRVRIMVTVPSEAATEYELVHRLVAAGMDCMRINCAHDTATAWESMIANLRRAEKETGRSCKVEMDVAGPKLRTGPMEPAPAVLKYRPQRDAFGRVEKPARIWLTAGAPAPGPADASLPVSRHWLAQLKPEMRARFSDARGARRSMQIREKAEGGVWADADRTAYIVPGLALAAEIAKGRRIRTRIGSLPKRPGTLLLHPGDTLVLARDLAPGHPATPSGEPARIGVTLPEFFEAVKPGDPIWFDDGAIGGEILTVQTDHATVTIVNARPEGQKLGAEKGINIPESNLPISAITEEDRRNLAVAAQHADIIGLSFVRTVEDVRDARQALAQVGKEQMPVMLKIETRAGFENLPQLLMEAMRNRGVGVMIARGDLAVECGFSRLAELQEEILWIAEAAHVPVVWATQVLESLAKTGRPSRSEITDAAMGERAECVMLNKGPYVVEAVMALDDILARMESHQQKKTAMLRKLRVASAFVANGSSARTRSAVS